VPYRAPPCSQEIDARSATLSPSDGPSDERSGPLRSASTVAQAEAHERPRSLREVPSHVEGRR